MMVTAMLRKKGSTSSGATPSTVVAAPRNTGRARLADALGLGFRLPAAAGAECDLVFHASGHPAGLATALELAGQEATVIEMSWYGRTAVSVPLGGAFHARRLGIKSSQVGHVPPQKSPRWTYRRRMELALSLLVDPRLDALISGETAFQDLPALMQRLAFEPAGALCERIRYPDAGTRDDPTTNSGDDSCTA